MKDIPPSNRLLDIERRLQGLDQLEELLAQKLPPQEFLKKFALIDLPPPAPSTPKSRSEVK